MPRYRKRDSDVSAFQWFPEMGEIGGVIKSKTYASTVFPDSHAIQSAFKSQNTFIIITVGGPIAVYPGDWIVTGSLGNQYKCDPDQFEDLFERMAEHEHGHRISNPSA